MGQAPAGTHLDGGRLPTPAETPAPINRRLVVFEGGVPVAKDVPLFTPAVIKDVHTAALAELYAEPEDALAVELGLPTSEFYGRTLLEVMLIRRARAAAKLAGAEPERVEMILDRELGKPKTTSENTNHNHNYETALLDIDAAERVRAAKTVKPTIVDAQVVEPWESLV